MELKDPGDQFGGTEGHSAIHSNGVLHDEVYYCTEVCNIMPDILGYRVAGVMIMTSPAQDTVVSLLCE
jgi:hypothetical protein